MFNPKNKTEKLEKWGWEEVHIHFHGQLQENSHL